MGCYLLGRKPFRMGYIRNGPRMPAARMGARLWLEVVSLHLGDQHRLLPMSQPIQQADWDIDLRTTGQLAVQAQVHRYETCFRKPWLELYP